MANSSIQDQIHNLDARVRKVEGVLEKHSPSGWWTLLKNSLVNRQEEQLARVAGWFVITASLMGIINDWINVQSVNVLFALSLAFGFWLLARSVPLFDMSDSTRELYHEYRAGKAKSAVQLHSAPHSHRRYINGPILSYMFMRNTLLLCGGAVVAIVFTWFLMTNIPHPIWQMVPFLALLLILLAYGLARSMKWVIYNSAIGIFLLLMMSQAPLFAIISLIGMALLLTYFCLLRKDWVLLGVTTVLSYLSLLRWLNHFALPDQFPQLLSADQWMVERQCIFIAGLLFVALFSIPFIIRRREIEDREMSRLILVASSVGYVLTMSWLASYLGIFRWVISLSSLVVIYAAFGYLSWMRFKRLSYAKYFLFLALSACLLFIYTYLDPVAVALLWFIISVVVMTLGFVLSSYSARTVGLAALGLTLMQYIFVILPNPEQYAGPVWLHERVWLGVVLSIYLPLLGLWFRDMKARGIEARLIPTFVTTFFCTSFLFLFGVVTLESVAPLQTGLWIVLGLAAVFVGIWQKLTLLRSLGLALSALAFVKLFLVDALAFSQNWQIITFLLFGLSLIAIALLGHHYQRQLSHYFSNRSIQ